MKYFFIKGREIRPLYCSLLPRCFFGSRITCADTPVMIVFKLQLSCPCFKLIVVPAGALGCYVFYLAACGLNAFDKFVPEYTERGDERDGYEQDDQDVLCHALSFLTIILSPWHKIEINHIVLLKDELYSLNTGGVRFVKKIMR